MSHHLGSLRSTLYAATCKRSQSRPTTSLVCKPHLVPSSLSDTQRTVMSATPIRHLVEVKAAAPSSFTAPHSPSKTKSSSTSYNGRRMALAATSAASCSQPRTTTMAAATKTSQATRSSTSARKSSRTSRWAKRAKVLETTLCSVSPTFRFPRTLRLESHTRCTGCGNGTRLPTRILASLRAETSTTRLALM